MAIVLDDLISMALFARVVEMRSFSQVAEQMGVSKSVVSTRISRLEERLGVRLLHRTTRRMTLTEEGSSYYEHCARIVQAAEDAELEVSESAREVQGPLRITAPVALSQMHLADAIAEFIRRNSRVEVFLNADDRITDLMEGGYDLAVRMAQRLEGDLVARRLATDHLVICASPAYLDRFGTPSSLKSLTDHRCLRYANQSNRQEWALSTPDGTVVIPIQGSIVTNDSRVLLTLALAGCGVAVLPHYLVSAEVRQGSLVTLLEPELKMELGIYAVYPHRKVTRRVRAFVEFLVFWFGEGRGFDPGKRAE